MIITAFRIKDCILSSQSYGQIVPTLCSYSSNLQTRDLDLLLELTAK